MSILTVETPESVRELPPLEKAAPGPLAGSPGEGVKSVRVCFGRRWVTTELLGRLDSGSVLELDGDEDSMAEICADGRLVGYGSLVVVEGKLCIRLEKRI
jgi:hypothetical protein